MPLVALNLEAMTGSAAIVGTNAAAAALSTLLATPLIPALMARAAPKRTVVICALITALGFVLFPAMPDPVVWFGLRFVMGLSVTIIFVASETWINQLAKPESRASLLAVYATVLSGGFGSGGLLLDCGRGDLCARSAADPDSQGSADRSPLS
jgi:MFS family permease